MKLYIARDKDGELYLYFTPFRRVPVLRIDDLGIFMKRDAANKIKLNKNMFPKVTWENSPKEVILQLV